MTAKLSDYQQKMMDLFNRGYYLRLGHSSDSQYDMFDNNEIITGIRVNPRTIELLEMNGLIERTDDERGPRWDAITESAVEPDLTVTDVVIPVIPSQAPTKAQEIAFLRAVAASIPETAYVADLLHPAMIDYVEMLIGNDLPADIFQRLQYAETEREEAYSDLRAANRKIDDLQRGLNAMTAESNQTDAAMKKMHERIIDLEIQVVAAEREIADNDAKDEQIAALELQVLRLKAELYDASRK